jgi:hypothetical protein
MEIIPSRLDVCDHVISQLEPDSAYVLGPRSALGKLVELYRRSAADVNKVVIDSSSPFSEGVRDGLLDLLKRGGKTEKESKYLSFYTFCYHISRHRYIPTSSILELLPTLSLDVSVRQDLAIVLTSAQPGTIKRISAHGYAAMTDDGSIVFVNKHHGYTAFTLKSVLKMSLFALAWASGPGMLPKRLRYKYLEPRHHYAKTIISELIELSKQPRLSSYAFYAKALIPTVVEHAVTLFGYIATNYEVVESDAQSTGEGEEVCMICLTSLATTEPSVILPCGHVFHTCCRHASISSGISYCAICRAC